jgi:hypothetical protein
MTDLFNANLGKYGNPERYDERIVSQWLFTAD